MVEAGWKASEGMEALIGGVDVCGIVDLASEGWAWWVGA